MHKSSSIAAIHSQLRFSKRDDRGPPEAFGRAVGEAMAAFRPEALIEKLGKLNATQQSIEMVSQYCIFFKKASSLLPL